MSWTVHLHQTPDIYRGPYAAVAVGDELYCFGGDAVRYVDVHVFNTVSLRWRELTPETPGTGERHLEVPSRRWGHTAVLIEYTVYLWGGWTNQGYDYCNVLYAFDVDAHTWFKPQVSGTVPEGRGYHSACVLGKVMYIHGGTTQTGDTMNDMYKLDTSTMVWSLINTRGTPPPDSECHSATIIRTKMFVFGGCGDQNNTTIRVFDTETNSWFDTPRKRHPGVRLFHSAFTYNGQLYIFGGRNEKARHFNDVWRLNPETLSWKKVKPKGKRPHKVRNMCCCMVGDSVILFGPDNRPDDLYVLDFSPSLKTLCKLAVIQYGLEQSGLPHNIRWELAAMTSNSQ